MEITVKEIVGGFETLKNVMEKGTEFNALTAFKIHKLLGELKPIVQAYQEAVRVLLDKYGEEDKENPEQHIIPKESVQKYADEYDKILEKKETLEVDKINIDELADLKLDIRFFEGLSPFINT